MKRVLQGAAGFVIVFGIWECMSLMLHHPMLPGPVSLLQSFNEYRILSHLFSSLLRIGTGLLFAVLIGVPLGITAAVSPRLGGWIDGCTWLFYPVPKIMFLPLLLVLFGVGSVSKVILITSSLVFLIIISVRDRIRSLPRQYHNTISSLGGNALHELRYVYLPALVPGLFTTLRIGLTIGAGVLFFAENFGSSSGIGWFIMDSRTRVDYVSLYRGILALSGALFILFGILSALEALLCPWSGKQDA